MKSESPTADAVELLLLAGLVALEAAAVLLVSLVALALAAAGWRPSASPARSLPPPPALHPLALVAEELLELPAAALRPMAGVRSKRLPKRELVALVACC
ncbi:MULTISPECIES: hypothetical protein [unclassified Cyanobium]|uniref:hypothetical protein n=1 Tax=unclassified Cyanobium TaxID=2627006 RepID=UPI0020CB7B10|nr:MULTISPECIES: hypothetical protein [unclassified Cyanobium]MCP9861083.1 hypothetical protein [Cyanobium sp. Cruz-8H5]MCP9868317.1 hypothetical protein [Cyanobium sp. Cruz-8D1]